MVEIISPNFIKKIRLENQNIIYKKLNEKDPVVTVGVPTFRRQTLSRTLESLSKQKFRKFVVIVSDNDGFQQNTLDTVSKFQFKLPNIYLIAQKENIGNLGNVAFLLNCAYTKFFMWLHDDDEISENYIESLYEILMNNPKATTAMGRWKKMSSPTRGVFPRQINNSNNNTLKRITNFIAFDPDDSSFFGLHRTNKIRKAEFPGYFGPNSKVISNNCYLIIFDLLLQGSILNTEESIWYSHAYSEKAYSRSSGATFRGKLLILIRRINVYVIYCQKAYKFKKNYVLFVFMASLAGLSRDIFSSLIKSFARTLSRI